MKSWKTTAVGIIGVVVAVLVALKAVWDGDPDTNPEWSVVGAAVLVAFGLLFARDNDVTSEKAGAKK